MTKAQSQTGLNSSGSDTHDGQMKIYLWLIIATMVGATVFICVLVLQPLLQGNTPRYSPANFVAEFEKNHAKWDEADVTHYKLVVDFSGYGLYDQMPWTLEIKNDKVISLIDAQGNSVLVNDSTRRFTVTALFAGIEDRYQGRAPSIQVSYNPTYGYPEYISVNPYKEPCCQGYNIKIRGFQVLP